MRAWGTLLGLVLVACGGAGVRELRGSGDDRVYESKCKSSSAECIASARETCSSGYAVLDSESHAGGLLADLLPGPVTWYAMTFRCDGFGGSERPDFPFHGASYVEPAAPAPEPRAASEELSPATPAMRATGPHVASPSSCRSDFECGSRSVCAKPQGAFEGTCGRAVDRNGTPTFPTPRPSSIGPGGEGQCAFDTDCPVGFRCIRGSALRGNCMR